MKTKKTENYYRNEQRGTKSANPLWTFAAIFTFNLKVQALLKLGRKAITLGIQIVVDKERHIFIICLSDIRTAYSRSQG